MKIKYDSCRIENAEIFYRVAGDPSKPAVLLLQGFPSSSSQYRQRDSRASGLRQSYGAYLRYARWSQLVVLGFNLSQSAEYGIIHN